MIENPFLVVCGGGSLVMLFLAGTHYTAYWFGRNFTIERRSHKNETQSTEAEI